MPEVWPAGVPSCFTFQSAQRTTADGRLRAQTDMGPGKVRLRSTAMPGALAGQLVMTWAQLEDLKTFVAVTTLDGSLPFLFPSQLTGTSLLVRFGDKLPEWRRHSLGKAMVDIVLEILP